MPMGEPGKTGRHDGGRPASSLNRLLDDVARQLGCPSGDEEVGSLAVWVFSLSWEG